MAEPFDFAITQKQYTLTDPQFLTASDTTKLAYYAYVPKSPQAIIISFHGSGAWSCGEYHGMAQEFANKHNFGCYLVDRRGHGNSSGPRGDAPSTQQVWRDVDTIIDFVKTKHPNLPVILAGHSSGAGLILNYLSWKDHKNSVDGYLFLAPFLGVESGVLRDITDPEKAFIKHVRTWALIGHALTGGWLFAHTPALFFNYPDWIKQQDKHILDYYTSAMAASDYTRTAQQDFEKLDKPFAIFIGSEEEMFVPEKVVAFAKYSTQPSITSIVQGAKHLSIIGPAPALCTQAIEQLILKK